MKRDRDRAAAGKENMWLDQDAAGMDELFAVLGYKVKSSDMADVADKLEQLDMAMATTTTMADNGDIVHYNPSDLSGWVGSLYSDLYVNPNLIGASDDLRAIPGGAIFGDKKRIKSELPKYGCLSAHPVLLVDSQEAGVSLVHTLMACAEAVQQGNVKLAGALLRNVGVLAVSQVGAMRKVATYFAEALARKIYKIYPSSSLDSSYGDVLQMHFYETGPYLKFAHFTANQSILEAFAGENRVHVVDFSLKQGMQWPALMHALALRPGGPPSFRITGIGPPQPDNSDELQQVGLKLAQLANTIGVEFEFRGFVANSLADLDAGMLGITPGNDEAVAVNSIFELHMLLSRSGAIDKVLDLIRMISPKIVTMVEQEADHNGKDFLERFNGALHYYSNVFDSLESSGPARPDKQDIAMTEIYLGRQICNVVACEGSDRVERHETLALWRRRLRSAGFDPVHMCSNAFKQASMLLELFAGGHGYMVEENDGCLMLGWHTRQLIASSAWRLAAGGRLGLDSESWVDSERVGGHHTTSGGRAEMG